MNCPAFARANGEAMSFFGKGSFMGWYALFVETGREELVEKQINSIMYSSEPDFPYELLIAKREIQEKKAGVMRTVIKRMFPGYILLQTEQVLDFYFKTKRCYRLLGVLRQEVFFKEIKLEEISNIVYMTDEDGVIGKSDVFVANDRIIVIKGPLKNYDGYIKKVDRRKNRVKVVFLFNGTKHYINLSVNFIEKYHDAFEKEIPFFTDKYLR